MKRRTMRRTFSLALLATLVAVPLGACGANEQQASEPRPLPEELSQALQPGEYRSEEFEPSLTFKVGQGWATYTPEEPDVLRIERGTSAGLGFMKIRKVYEPGSLEVEDAPEDLVGWFRRHPYLRTTDPEPATVGGVEGVRFDVVVGKLPESYHSVCLAISSGIDCVDIAKFSDEQMLFHAKGAKARVIVMEDVEGQTVTAAYGGATAQFADVMPEAQKVMDTVEWGGS